MFSDAPIYTAQQLLKYIEDNNDFQDFDEILISTGTNNLRNLTKSKYADQFLSFVRRIMEGSYMCAKSLQWDSLKGNM